MGYKQRALASHATLPLSLGATLPSSNGVPTTATYDNHDQLKPAQLRKNQRLDSYLTTQLCQNTNAHPRQRALHRTAGHFATAHFKVHHVYVAFPWYKRPI